MNYKSNDEPTQKFRNLTPIPNELKQKKSLLKNNIVSSSTLVKLTNQETDSLTESIKNPIRESVINEMTTSYRGTFTNSLRNPITESLNKKNTRISLVTPSSYKNLLPPIHIRKLQPDEISKSENIEEKIIYNKNVLETDIAKFLNNKCYYIYNDIICSISIKNTNNNHKFIYISLLSKKKPDFEYAFIYFNIFLLQESFDYSLIKDIIYIKFYTTCLLKYDILHGHMIKNIYSDDININIKEKINIIRKNDLNKINRKVKLDIESAQLTPLYEKMIEAIDLYFFDYFIENKYKQPNI